MEEAVQLILKMWTEPRTTFHGRYFHIDNAILEPKPVQKPRPPVMIAGGGEQMTLRAVARLADACNIVGGEPAEVKYKFDVLRRHCDAVGRDYDTIEKTHVQAWILARNDAAVAAKRERLAARGLLPGFVGTVSEAIDLIGQYEDAGVELLINGERNDAETRELFASDVMPSFA
jgi:alkanesulfonate monooxygenase SsuD/methylene tetrahydromethanopterin reductase-like flavin-dependent oxidoreductase (luciferase family)